ncbi:MAG: hypothetical protein K9N49_05660, partial [Candidatus Marinimicrobia bacterium]|nr:hypothetical protein [Candidatus Neomarinimicrobiota bacterium]
TAVVVDGQEIHGGGALVVGVFYGGVAELIFVGPRTIVPELRVGRRDVRAWRALGALDGPGLCSAQVTYEGGGLTFRSTIVVSAAAGQTLRFTPFVPADYEVERLTGNGEALTRDALGAVTAATGDGRVVLEVNYKHSLLDLPPATWRDAVLLQADAAQIQVVMPEEAGAFDQGTLNWLNHFLLAYDYEDNIVGNLAPLDPAPGGTPPAAAWQLTMDTTGLAERTAVLLDGPQIVVTGRDAFARRRAMAVFMRLLDRKYPAVGHFLFPADLKAYESLDAMLDRKVAQLIEAHNLHRKPLLDDAHEPLYAGDNLDFHGKYVLRVSPYIYEPGDWR